MSWLLEPLGTNTQDRYLDKKFWFQAADNLMYTGKAPEFFCDTLMLLFEHKNVNLPKYMHGRKEFLDQT